MVLKEFCTPLVKTTYNRGRVTVDVITLFDIYSDIHIYPQNLLPHLLIGQLNNFIMVSKEKYSSLVKATYNKV